MNCKNILLLAIIIHLTQLTLAGTESTSTKKSSSATTPSAVTSSEIVPKLQPDEFALYADGAYKIIKSKTYQKLELTTDCFKNDKPKCIAYSVSLEKPAPVKIKISEANNLAVLNCIQVGGKSFIALDHKNNEYNFCRFSDGSMVTAWSMYFKQNPIPTIK